MASGVGPVDLVKRPPLLGGASGIVRIVLAVVIGGALAAIGWLLLMQEAYTRGITDHDFNKFFAQAFTEAGGAETARVGLRATLVAGVVLAALFALAGNRLTRGRSGVVASAMFAVVPFLAWGLLLAPVIDARRPPLAGVEGDPIPGGVFGIDAGAGTPIAALVASFLTAMIVVRSYRLMTTADWWSTRPAPLAQTADELDSLAGLEPLSLQLPEERPKEARKGAGA